MLLYVAVVTTVLARTQTGQFFLKIEWFDSIALFFGGVFCILCMGIQFFFPKLHPPFRAKNYIQFFIVLLLLSPYRSAFASYKQYISSVAPYSWDKTFMRGYEAERVLRANGFTNVTVMEGGISAWPFAREK